jgi:glutamine synthetase
MEGITRAADPGAPWNENLYALVRAAPEPGKMPERLPRTFIEASMPLVPIPDRRNLRAEFRDIYLRQKTRRMGTRLLARYHDEERAAMMEFI